MPVDQAYYGDFTSGFRNLRKLFCLREVVRGIAQYMEIGLTPFSLYLVSFQQFQTFYPSPTIPFHFAQKKVHHAQTNVQNQIPQKINISKISELISSILIATQLSTTEIQGSRSSLFVGTRPAGPVKSEDHFTG